MTYPTFPDHLAGRVELAIGASPADGRVVTAMDAGPSKMRRRTSAAERPVRCRLTLQDSDRAFLERWWDEDLGGGVSPFWFRDLMLHGHVLATEDLLEPLLLTDTDDYDIVCDGTWLVRFGERGPTWSQIGAGVWRVEFELRILP